MIQAAQLWPVSKQASAVTEALGYYVHYEQASGLIGRYRSFLDEHELLGLLPSTTRDAVEDASETSQG